MGLIKAISGAIRSEMADQWKEYFVLDSMPSNVLVQKGYKNNTTTHFGSSNVKGSDDIITKGSVIAVNEGQAMLVVEQGKIVDFTCEAGAYTFDSSTEPSMFSGSFGKGLVESFKNVGKRFTFGGDTGNNQRVYYINTKEIMGNKYGSAQPMSYDDPYYKTVLYIRYFGMFSFKITDPVVFYTGIAGNVADIYTSENIIDQSRSEFLTALDTAINKLAGEGVKFSALPSKQLEITEYMNDALDNAWKERRGMEITAVSMEKITPDDRSRERIETFDNAVMLGGNQSAMQGRIVSAEATMFENIGKSEGGASSGDVMGAAMGMMGMNMMNNMMGNMQNNNAGGQTQPAAAGQMWKCACGHANSGKFCEDCGAKKPQYKCNKCGFEPADKSNPPKFCPECGDGFNNEDLE